MRAPLVLAVVCILTLAGCTPDTTEAYKNCYDTLSWATVDLDDSLTEDQAIEKLIEVADFCSTSAAEDPEAFIEEWSFD